MKNLKYIMATLMVALVVAVVFVGCKKEKETPVQEASNNSDNQPNTEVVERKPIAAKNLSTGEISYAFSMKDFQKSLDKEMETKGEIDRYIIETIEIEENAFQYENKSLSALKVVLIDTELEKSDTHWLFGGFIDEIIQGNEKLYYLGEDIYDKEYSFCKAGATNCLVSMQEESIISIDTINGLEYGPVVPWNLSCTTGPRCTNCRKNNPQGYWGGWTCECRDGYNPGSGVYCTGTSDSGNTIALIGIVVMIIIAL